MASGIQNFIQTVQRMQLSDYLDILVVALLIYSILPHLKSPNVQKIVKTVGTMVLVAWLTGEMKLYTINWILNQMLTIGLVAFVVLFQPELRYMLDHFGDMKIARMFGLSKPVQEMELIIQQTVSACEEMRRQKVGALVVFARKNRLNEYFKTGIAINGQVSDPLLQNIFVNETPLHDGAVIIQDGKIAAASCILPVSNSTTLPQNMGTRHRAGMGISEVSDAVAVVVSEEKKTITVFIGGVQKKVLSVDMLKTLLKNELCPEDTEKQNWWEQIMAWFDNLWKGDKKQ